jgi:hypothetical protein
MCVKLRRASLRTEAQSFSRQYGRRGLRRLSANAPARLAKRGLSQLEASAVFRPVPVRDARIVNAPPIRPLPAPLGGSSSFKDQGVLNSQRLRGVCAVQELEAVVAEDVDVGGEKFCIAVEVERLRSAWSDHREKRCQPGLAVQFAP